MITVVIVTWQGAELLPACLGSLRQQTAAHHVLVVDNASTDPTTAVLAGFPECEVLRLATNTGFAGGVQAGLDQVRTPYCALLNNDARAEPGWLAALGAGLDADRGLAALTSRILLDQAGAAIINNAGVVLLATGYGADRGLGAPDGPAYDEPVEVFGFSGGGCALRTDAIRAVGGFATSFFLYYEDTDLSWRLRLAGWRIGYSPAAVVHHLHSATTDQRSELFAFHNERNRLLMLTRCAPAGIAVAAVARFGMTTASLLLTRLRGRTPGPEWNFRMGLRLRVLGSYFRLLPAACAARRWIGRTAVLPRRHVATRWMAPEVSR